VVSTVLEATVQELLGKGFGQLRVERVAKLAGVNKTSIYRRWPTQGQLICAALTFVAAEFEPPKETGVLRTDLLALFRQWSAKARSGRVQGLIRLINQETLDAQVTRTLSDLRAAFRARWVSVLSRAIDRGELVTSYSPQFLMELISAAVLVRLRRTRGEVTERYLSDVVDFVLRGARR
jgi:AcrR family transcriptional regulator